LREAFPMSALGGHGGFAPKRLQAAPGSEKLRVEVLTVSVLLSFCEVGFATADRVCDRGCFEGVMATFFAPARSRFFFLLRRRFAFACRSAGPILYDEPAFSRRRSAPRHRGSLMASTGRGIEVASPPFFRRSRRPIEDVSAALARGVEKPGRKEKGPMASIIGVALEEHAMRIEVGYGLEVWLPDALAGRIRSETTCASFGRGAFGDGILKALIQHARGARG